MQIDKLRTLTLIALTTLAVAFDAGASVDNELTAEQFLRLIQSQQSAIIRDVAFAYEGEREYLGPEGEENEPLTPFQGRYALRADGATFVETYLEGNVNPRNAHPVRTLIGGQSQMAYVSPSWKARSDRPTRKSTGGPGSCFFPESPETWMFLWRYQSLKGVSDFGYEFLGWEDVDGHRCAHIKFNSAPSITDWVTQELWVDLERGGHPLRIKNSDGNQTVYLVDQVTLSQFTLSSGEEIWFPVGGRFNEFYHNDGYTKEPMVRLTSYILNGTIVFNQGLKDGVFQIEGDPFRPAFTVLPAVAPAQRSGMDSVDAEQKLDAALAEALRKAGAGDATTSLRAESAAGSITAWGLGLGGAAILVIAGFIALRRR